MNSRRKFLKLAVAASSLPITKCLAIESCTKEGEINMLSSLYKRWVHHYGQTPEKFLASLGQGINDPLFYQAKIKNDFLIGDVFEFGGVVMSKTEAAGISTLITL